MGFYAASPVPPHPDITAAFPPTFWPPGLSRTFLVPILLANTASYVLLGSLIVQILYYIRTYQKDKLRTRVVVAFLLVANLAQASSQLARDIVILGLGFGDWRKLGDFHSRAQDFITTVLSVIIISTSQSVIAIRSYLFCRSMSVGSTSKLVVAWAFIRAVLILGSLAFGIGAIISEFSYPNLFLLGAVNYVSDVGRSTFPLCEMMWLLMGTVADISIAWSMYADARRAKTGYGTSSDSFLQILINVSLRCGVILTVVQTVLNCLYFADSPVWADAAHSILPRVSSLTVLYSITSPREAYRAFLVQQERRREQAEASLDQRSGASLSASRVTNSNGGIGSRRGITSPSTGGRSSRGSSGGATRKWRGLRPSFLSLGGKRRRTSRLPDEEFGPIEEGEKGRVEEGLRQHEGGSDMEEGTAMEESARPGGRGRTRVRVAPARAVNVQTTSVISVERVEEEGEERLGNSVTVEGLRSYPPRPRHNRHLVRISSSSVPRDSPSRRPHRTNSDPQPHRPPPSPSSHPSPPNFIDSFPARPTVTSSVGAYDEAMVDEMFDL